LPHPHSPEQVQCSTPTSPAGVTLQLAVYAVHFCWGRGFQSVQGLHVPRVWVGGMGRESHVIGEAHLFILQIHASSFRASQLGEMGSTLLSTAWRKDGFHRLGVQDVASFDSD
jgi:hypothetical protein